MGKRKLTMESKSGRWKKFNLRNLGFAVTSVESLFTSVSASGKSVELSYKIQTGLVQG